MRELTAHNSKPLIKLWGRSMVDWQLDRLKKGGIREAVVNTAHYAELYPSHFAEHPVEGIRVTISRMRWKPKAVLSKHFLCSATGKNPLLWFPETSLLPLITLPWKKPVIELEKEKSSGIWYWCPILLSMTETWI